MKAFYSVLYKPPFIEAWGRCLAVSQVEPDSPLTSLLLASPFFFFFCGLPGGNSCIPQEAIHSPQEERVHAIAGESSLLARPSGSTCPVKRAVELRACQNCIRLPNFKGKRGGWGGSYVGQIVSGQSRGGTATRRREQTGYLQ